MTAAGAVLLLLSLPFAAAAAYLALLALAARGSVPPPAQRRTRFDVVVPAHDEEAGIAETVRSLLALDYPRELFRVVVVADNCSDATASRAAAAGARVLERRDPTKRGKGFALAYAFELLRAERVAGAFVVVDADTLVSGNLLGAFASRLEAGARALQASYGVRNREASWRTRLLHLAFTLMHDVRSKARERLGLSCGLRGNGMAFTGGLLERVPYGAFSIVEDIEYGLQLGLAGERVGFVAEAQVVGEMAAGEQASRAQRARWEGGRLALAKLYGPRLLGRAVRERSALLLDLAADLLVPPLSYLTLAVAVGLGASGLGLLRGPGTVPAAAVWAAAAVALAGYVARGWVEARLGWRGAIDLLHVPWFVLWKLGLWARRLPGRGGEWVRTTREGAAGRR